MTHSISVRHTFKCRTNAASAAGSPGSAATRSAAANTTGAGGCRCCSVDVAKDEVSGSGSEVEEVDIDDDERRDELDRGCSATRNPRDCDCESSAEAALPLADERNGGKSDDDEAEADDRSLRFGGGGGASDESTARDALKTAGGLLATGPLAAVGDAAAVGLALAVAAAAAEAAEVEEAGTDAEAVAGGDGDVDCTDEDDRSMRGGGSSVGFDSAPAFAPCRLAPSNVARVCTAADATSEGAIVETVANSGSGGCAPGAVSSGNCPLERHCGSDEDAGGAADDEDAGG
jgi:hypothetical protein